MKKEFFTIKEVAHKIVYSERRVRQMCIEGKIEAEKISDDARKWLIPVTELERLKAGSEFTRKAKQKTYEETPHKQKMREIAGTMAGEISLPWILHILIVELKPRRFLPDRGSVLTTVAENGEIGVELSIEGKGEIDHLYQGLRTHLETGGFSQVFDEIGN